MITGIHHIAIIVSSENSIDFYARLGFKEVKRKNRGYDTIVFMEGYEIALELFIDPSHPKHITNPEAMGLRHLALKVDNIERTIEELGIEAEPVREVEGVRLTFFKDPDGLPIELHE